MSIDIECEKSKNQSSTAYKLPSSAVSTQDPAPEALGDLRCFYLLIYNFKF